MSDITLLEIKVPATAKLRMFNQSQKIRANSAVLNNLFPQLKGQSVNLIKPKTKLQKIDSYMLQETQLLLNKIETYCGSEQLDDGIELSLYFDDIQWCVSETFTKDHGLVQLLNQDKWIIDVSQWLSPNYTGLAYSQELLAFSYLYAKNKQVALQKYKHFSDKNQGCICKIKLSVRSGIASLKFCVESPTNSYLIEFT
ncbi:hypothetical protein L0668_07380 [Paraglaciecola aquimarina]|uniref:Uncharacterized protein n=1 Tax=Paraglaciecola algarum TaxID=3050085 RepID=A0ABS9D4P4_9ALTE|nr:hypothetical protein [Paraglaciecola sp. G1-23]MCF2947922.1 hypothetical protein [Paraglaciecola sp. G1-23]